MFVYTFLCFFNSLTFKTFFQVKYAKKISQKESRRTKPTTKLVTASASKSKYFLQKHEINNRKFAEQRCSVNAIVVG